MYAVLGSRGSSSSGEALAFEQMVTTTMVRSTGRRPVKGHAMRIPDSIERATQFDHWMVMR